MAVSHVNCAIYIRGMELLQYCFDRLYLKLTSLLRHFFTFADFYFVLKIVFLAIVFLLLKGYKSRNIGVPRRGLFFLMKMSQIDTENDKTQNFLLFKVFMHFFLKIRQTSWIGSL